MSELDIIPHRRSSAWYYEIGVPPIVVKLGSAHGATPLRTTLFEVFQWRRRCLVDCGGESRERFNQPFGRLQFSLYQIRTLADPVPSISEVMNYSMIMVAQREQGSRVATLQAGSHIPST